MHISKLYLHIFQDYNKVQNNVELFKEQINILIEANDMLDKEVKELRKNIERIKIKQL